MLEHLFDTERLTVYGCSISTELHCIPRIQFLAYHREVDRPMLVANMLLCGQWVDWLEVSSEYRRQGYATELKKAVDERYGPLESSPGSADGEAFILAYEASEEPQP